MGAWNVRAIVAAVFVLFAAAFMPCAAPAKDYCPAFASEGHLFGGTQAGLYSFVLSSESERVVGGEMFAETNLGWFRFLFGPAKIAVDRAQYRTPHGVVTADRYVSPAQYVQFPPEVTIVARAWVSRVRNVACDPPAGGGPTPGAPNALDASPVNPIPLVLSALPRAGTNVAVAVASTSPGDESCSRPFTDATVTEPYSPEIEKVQEAGRFVTVVEVSVSARGALDTARIVLPSGNDAFDLAALRAARLSKYAAGTALCRLVPGRYFFRAEATF